LDDVASQHPVKGCRVNQERSVQSATLPRAEAAEGEEAEVQRPIGARQKDAKAEDPEYVDQRVTAQVEFESNV